MKKTTTEPRTEVVLTTESLIPLLKALCKIEQVTERIEKNNPKQNQVKREKKSYDTRIIKKEEHAHISQMIGRSIVIMYNKS